MARAQKSQTTGAGGTTLAAGTRSRSRRPHSLPSLPPPPPIEPTTNGAVKRHRGSRGGRRHRRPETQEPQPETPPAPAPEAEEKPKRRRGSRGGRKHRRAEAAPEEAAPPAAPLPEAAPEAEAKAKRRRGTRGGRKHRRAGEKAAAQAATVPVEAAAPPAPAAAPRRGGRKKAGAAAIAPVAAPQKRAAPATRKRVRKPEAPFAYDEAAPTAGPAVAPRRTRIPVTGAPTEDVPPPFTHNAEYEFARILDFYGIEWQYEPRSFPLRWEHGRVTEAFTPDFYMPDLNLYVELTTLKTGLTAEKNRKMRLLKQLYPGVNIIMLKKRDYLRLLAKYGYGPVAPDQVLEIDQVLISTTKLQQRVSELGAQISKDYAGKQPVLVGILRGVLCFIADLMRHMSVPTSIDLMAISSYEGNGAAAVRILKDLDENIKGRDVILVEDIVDTGMTLNHVLDYLHTKRPASLKVCTLLDKRARRIINVELDYVGFEVPDEFVVGYGLDFHQRFRNLPFIATLKHELLP